MARTRPDELISELDELLTGSEVAGALHISRSTLFKLIARDEIRPVRIGRVLRFRRHDVEAYILRYGEEIPWKKLRKRKSRS